MATVWWTACACCSKPFIMRRSDATYCSPACRQRAYRQRQRCDLTPAMASALLSTCLSINSHERIERAQRYADIMRAGKWRDGAVM